MKNKWLMPDISTMEVEQKMQIITNSLARRFKRTDPLILDEDMTDMVDSNENKIIFSGYPWHIRMKIIDA